MNKDNNVNDNDNDDDNDDDDDYDDDKSTIREMSNYLKRIGETKSFEDQIDILKKNTLVKWILGYVLLWR